MTVHSKSNFIIKFDFIIMFLSIECITYNPYSLFKFKKKYVLIILISINLLCYNFLNKDWKKLAL